MYQHGLDWGFSPQCGQVGRVCGGGGLRLGHVAGSSPRTSETRRTAPQPRHHRSVGCQWGQRVNVWLCTSGRRWGGNGGTRTPVVHSITVAVQRPSRGTLTPEAFIFFAALMLRQGRASWTCSKVGLSLSFDFDLSLSLSLPFSKKALRTYVSLPPCHAGHVHICSFGAAAWHSVAHALPPSLPPSLPRPARPPPHSWLDCI